MNSQNKPIVHQKVFEHILEMMNQVDVRFD